MKRSTAASSSRLFSAAACSSPEAKAWATQLLTCSPRIFRPSLVALGQTIDRFIHPRFLTHLWLLALAGLIGFLGNELAAQVRLRAGRRLQSPALVADGKHARVDGFVSLGVLASAAVVSVGLKLGDPIIGLLITLVILRITWESWTTIRSSQPGEMLDEQDTHRGPR